MRHFANRFDVWSIFLDLSLLDTYLNAPAPSTNLPSASNNLSTCSYIPPLGAIWLKTSDLMFMIVSSPVWTCFPLSFPEFFSVFFQDQIWQFRSKSPCYLWIRSLCNFLSSGLNCKLLHELSVRFWVLNFSLSDVKSIFMQFWGFGLICELVGMFDLFPWSSGCFYFQFFHDYPITSRS